LKVTFLGTGTSQGVPVIACNCDVCGSKDPRDKRLRTSILVEADGVSIIVDSGPDFREQMLRYNVQKLDGLLLTHEHRDHTGGLDEVRGFNFITRQPVDVYATKDVQTALHRDYTYVFSKTDYPGLPKVVLHEITTKPFSINGLLVVPVQVKHHKMPVLGFRFGDFTYITDANFISEDEKEKVRGSKVVVLNALRRKEHISHFTLDQALELALELGAEKTYFTHVSHQLGSHEPVCRELPEGVELAYDGLIVQL